MKIYNLIYIDTQEGFTPKDVKSFATEELAVKEMLKDISENYNIPMEELEKGYEDVDWCIGYNYAHNYTDQCYWEIMPSELSTRESTIATIIEKIHKEYVIPNRYDGTLYKLINEFKDNELELEFQDFLDDYFIGVALYENALAELGGKTDEDSTCAIYDFIDGYGLENMTDIKKLVNQEFWELSKDEREKLDCYPHLRWLLAMIIICSGEEDTFLNAVRTEIDKNRPIGKKIFEEERIANFKKEYKNLICPNHRELCSTLTDEQYYSIMLGGFERVWHFGGNNENLNDLIKYFYEEANYTIWKYILKYGIDELLDTYSYVIEIEEIADGNWNFVLVGDPFEVANCVETLKKKL